MPKAVPYPCLTGWGCNPLGVGHRRRTSVSANEALPGLGRPSPQSFHPHGSPAKSFPMYFSSFTDHHPRKFSFLFGRMKTGTLPCRPPTSSLAASVGDQHLLLPSCSTAGRKTLPPVLCVVADGDRRPRWPLSGFACCLVSS